MESRSSVDDSDNDTDYFPTDDDSSLSSKNDIVEATNEEETNLLMLSTNENIASEGATGESNSRVRKRLRNVQEHKRQMSKTRRNLRQSYKRHRNILKPARYMTIYLHNCRYKCNENFTEK